MTLIVFGTTPVSYTPGKAVPALDSSGNWSNIPFKASGIAPSRPISIPPRKDDQRQPKSWAQLAAAKKTVLIPSIPAIFTPSFHMNIITPRGLINNGNMCFMNVILQPLLHCNPFFCYFVSYHQPKEVSVRVPLIDAMYVHFLSFDSIVFLNQFQTGPPGSKIEQSNVDNSNPFAPKDIYNILRSLKKSTSQKGRQEDAEEFLGFLLDGLHEELLLIQKEASTTESSSPVEEWTEVGAKSKAISTRTTISPETQISRLFSGKMRSVLKCAGQKLSVTLEPFSTLQLGITNKDVHSIDDALALINVPETLEDFTSSKGEKVDASKQNFIESTPPVLILHLKRFIYNNDVGHTQKVHKHIAYPEMLRIKPELISLSSRGLVKLDYTLFAVVYHHGKIAAGGHYTVDIKRQAKEWLSIDDDSIRPISITEVLAENKDKQAYMLFYTVERG